MYDVVTECLPLLYRSPSLRAHTLSWKARAYGERSLGASEAWKGSRAEEPRGFLVCNNVCRHCPGSSQFLAALPGSGIRCSTEPGRA